MKSIIFFYVFTAYHVHSSNASRAFGRIPQGEDVVATLGVVLDTTVTTSHRARVPLWTRQWLWKLYMVLADNFSWIGGTVTCLCNSHIILITIAMRCSSGPWEVLHLAVAAADHTPAFMCWLNKQLQIHFSVEEGSWFLQSRIQCQTMWTLWSKHVFNWMWSHMLIGFNMPT